MRHGGESGTAQGVRVSDFVEKRKNDGRRKTDACPVQDCHDNIHGELSDIKSLSTKATEIAIAAQKLQSKESRNNKYWLSTIGAILLTAFTYNQRLTNDAIKGVEGQFGKAYSLFHAETKQALYLMEEFKKESRETYSEHERLVEEKWDDLIERVIRLETITEIKIDKNLKPIDNKKSTKNK